MAASRDKQPSGEMCSRLQTELEHHLCRHQHGGMRGEKDAEQKIWAFRVTHGRSQELLPQCLELPVMENGSERNLWCYFCCPVPIEKKKPFRWLGKNVHVCALLYRKWWNSLLHLKQYEYMVTPCIPAQYSPNWRDSYLA